MTGRITDPQGDGIPGVVVDATHLEAGFVRTANSDDEGTYRLGALPVGRYSLVISLSGFETQKTVVVVELSGNSVLNAKLALEKVGEAVTVNAPSIQSPGRQQNVSTPRLEGLPSNGRQLADFVSTVPGVSLGWFSDPSKSNQKTAQVNGNNGRSTNVIVDGGDNNDDVVGGIAQAYPLEAVDQITFMSQRFGADFGRGNSVMSLVTKSGTNTPRGSVFAFFRDNAMNAQTEAERIAGYDKQGYQRLQAGGGFGGPIVQNRAHYFAAYERNKQDTMQVVDTRILFPGETVARSAFPGDGVYNMRVRQDLFSGKVTVVPSTSHYLAVRYARDHNVQPSGAGRTTAYSAWAISTNTYDSFNTNHNWNLGRNRLNEFVFQFSNFVNDTPSSTTGPAIVLPDGTTRGGSNPSSPQSTEQRRWQFRDDFSWSLSGFGISHELRTGINIVHTPRLFVSNAALRDGQYTMRTADAAAGVGAIMVIGGTVSSNLPTDLYGFYLQDEWRTTDRLTLSLGVRYDYLSGIPIEQTSDNFARMQAAGATGRFAGTFLEDFGKTPRGDRNNIQPRLGAVYDLNGNGRNVLRGGFGIYTDLAYTNSNVLTTSLEGGGIIISATCLQGGAATAGLCDPTRGFILPSGELFTADMPWTSLNLTPTAPSTGEVVSPRLQQPFTYQTNAGWEHQLGNATFLTVDYVRVDGRNINMRIRPNTLVNGTRFLNGIGVNPNTRDFRTAVSAGRSKYDALIIGGRRRWANGFDFDASYTLSKAISHIGTAADELPQNLLQDVGDPFSEFQEGPSTRVDARHRLSASAIVEIPYQIRIASVLSVRSGLPITTIAGVDTNGDGTVNDHTQVAYRFTGYDNNVSTFEEMGPCESVNCSRRAPFSQLNLRVSRSFRFYGSARIEAIGEVFNVFNAKNPALPLSGTRTSPLFMQATAWAGDVGQGEQRVGQIGLRLSF